jgi:cob(I)alamin adenosyltransferase
MGYACEVRITRVYTRAGDAGQTTLVNGQKVSKAHPRVATYGDVDELNSVLGLARAENDDSELDQLLGRIQNELFVLGADLASPMEIAVPRISAENISTLEEAIDQCLEQLEPLKEFILPGGTRVASLLHLARTVARRAERAVVALMEREEVNPETVRYLNRLSDLLFSLARIANRRSGVSEESANFSQRK